MRHYRHATLPKHLFTTSINTSINTIQNWRGIHSTIISKHMNIDEQIQKVKPETQPHFLAVSTMKVATEKRKALISEKTRHAVARYPTSRIVSCSLLTMNHHTFPYPTLSPTRASANAIDNIVCKHSSGMNRH